ncbi:MAG TPA: hypothetical protein V6C63_21600 [Allocoleopsis sp.]
MINEIIDTQYKLVQRLQQQSVDMPSVKKLQELQAAIAGLTNLLSTRAAILADDRIGFFRLESMDNKDLERAIAHDS